VNSQMPIFTEKTRCQDCYKCVRQCPVKAIRVQNESAAVIAERCIYCGTCVNVCPVGAKKVREQIIQKAQDVIRKNVTTVQQIAYLLGENAAETELILGSIIESFQLPAARREGEP